MPTTKVVIRHEGSEWAVYPGENGSVMIMESRGPFGIPSRVVAIPPAIHVSVCKAIKEIARIAVKQRSSLPQGTHHE